MKDLVKYAILDTDFVSKANIIKSADRVLADIFCSDDKGARQGFANIASIPCISILSVFLKLWLLGKSYDVVQTYYQAFVDWCINRKDTQTTVRVWVFKTGTYKKESVRIEGVLTDIYAGKYEARKDGDLQLKRI